MDFSIRASRPDEGERLVEIWAASVDATHDFLTPDDRAAIGREVADFLPGVEAIVAADASDRPIAFILMQPGEISGLFVDPAARAHGVGRELVEFAVLLQGELITEVNAQNAQAVGFYKRMGFAEFERTELDGQGRPYPLLRMRRPAPADQT